MVLHHFYYTDEEKTAEIRLVRRTPDWLIFEIIKGEVVAPLEDGKYLRCHNLPIIGGFYQSGILKKKSIRNLPKIVILPPMPVEKVKMKRANPCRMTREPKMKRGR